MKDRKQPTLRAWYDPSKVAPSRLTPIAKGVKSSLSPKRYKMCGGYCRRVNIVSEGKTDEYPYDLSKMNPCDNPECNHENANSKTD